MSGPRAPVGRLLSSLLSSPLLSFLSLLSLLSLLSFLSFLSFLTPFSPRLYFAVNYRSGIMRPGRALAGQSRRFSQSRRLRAP